MRIAVDMDEVIADALSAQIAWLGERYGYAFSPEALHGRKLTEAITSDHARALQELLHEGAFFGDLKPIAGAQAALKALNRQAELFITTAAMEYPRSMPFKFDWLRTHFPFVNPMNIVFCGDKSIIAADVLVDDSPRHFEGFQGEGILFSAPHNRTERRFRRADDWEGVLALLHGRSRGHTGWGGPGGRQVIGSETPSHRGPTRP